MSDNLARERIMQGREHSRYRTLDGLRGIAALLVVVRHLNHVFGLPEAKFTYLSVDIFFILSGFVLSLSYGTKLQSGLGALNFLKIRVLRLYPLYLAGTALAALCGLLQWKAGHAGIGYIAKTITFSVFMLPSPSWSGSSNLFPFIVPAWSLFFEFYVANILFVVVSGKKLHSRSIAIVVASAVLLVAIVGLHGTIDVGSSWYTIVYAIPRVLFSFFLGVVLQVLHGRSTVLIPVQSWLILVTFLALMLASFAGPFSQFYEIFCAFIAFPVLVFLGAGAVETRPQLGALLGDMSYAVYAIHYPILLLISQSPARSLMLENSALRYAIVVGVAILAFVLSRADIALRKFVFMPTGSAAK